MGSLDPYLLVRFPYNYLGKNESFKVLHYKSIAKADSRLFGPYFLVQFPYNYLGKNQSF